MYFENAFRQRSIHTDMIFKGFSCFLFYLLKQYCPERIWTFSTSVNLGLEVGPRIIIDHDRVALGDSVEPCRKRFARARGGLYIGLSDMCFTGRYIGYNRLANLIVQ